MVKAAAVVAGVFLLSGCAILVIEQHAVLPVDKAFLAPKRALVDCSPVVRKEPPPETSRPVYKREIHDSWGERSRCSRPDRASGGSTKRTVSGAASGGSSS